MTIEKPPKKIPIAQKHPMHYLMHKYWARKPHNVVHDYIDYFTNKGDIVMDPFGGSGVTAIEAIKHNRKSISVDINPISGHIIEGTCIPIQTIEFDKEIKRIQEKIEPNLKKNYKFSCVKCQKKSLINYTVWSQQVTCESCKFQFPIIDAKKIKREYLCVKCNHKNKAKYSVKRDEIPVEIKYDCKHCKKSFVEKLSKNQINEIMKIQKKQKAKNLDGEMIYNPRTLVEKNMKVSDLFTQRNLEILIKIKEEILKISNYNLRKIMLFVFTASVAQSSRLIAYRGGLTTGGPAWTVSGFWLPPINMEINPLNNFINKAKKIKSGKKFFANNIDKIGISEFEIVKKQNELSKNKILSINKSINAISTKEIKSNSVDYIFTDPPYGDSVPYMEYCSLWANWLDEKLDYKNEIVISNSPDRKKTLEDYEKLISKAFENCFRVLKEGSWMSVTFHNRFLETWKVLLESIEKAGFTYISADYLVPAVISAKGQLSEGSLEGDVVLHYRKITPRKATNFIQKDFEPKIVSRIQDVITFMGGKTKINQIWNSIIFLLLENQSKEIPYEEIKPIIFKKFKHENGFIKNGKNQKKAKTLSIIVKKICEKQSSEDEHELLAKIYAEIPIWLSPPLSMVKEEIKKIDKKSNSTLEKFL